MIKKWYNIYKYIEIRNSKNSYYKKYFLDFKSNSNKIWNGINRLISQKKVNKSQTINLYENGQFITSQQEVAEKFNSYFTNVGKNLSDNIEYLGQHFSSFMPEPTAKSFFLEPTSPGEILLELKKLI